MARLILDTGVLVDAYRGRLNLAQRTATPRGPHDLIIAATARTADRIVLTTDSRARFGDLPDVHARLVTT